MIALEENQPATGAAPSDQIVRLIRRICLLREQGRLADARQLEETELPVAVKTAEQAGKFGAENLDQLYRTEKERAANAIVLSEMIVAQLHDHFPGATVPGQAVPSVPPSPPIPPASEAAGGPPAIPDLLDAMLAHDRSAARRHSASNRPGAGLNHNPTTRST